MRVCPNAFAYALAGFPVFAVTVRLALQWQHTAPRTHTMMCSTIDMLLIH